MDEALLYKDKPIFALDIGCKSLKVMQIAQGKKIKVLGYGVTRFDQTAIQDGIIVKPEVIAKALQDLIKNELVGSITTKRVALSLPAPHTFSHTAQLPKLMGKDIPEAVQTEAEQSIPHAIEDLYLDYEVVAKTDHETSVLIMAAPKKLVSSYISLAQIAGLEVAAIEPNINADCRLFKRLNPNKNTPAALLVDLGSVSSDLTVYENGIVVTGTAHGGGDNFTESIAKKLGVTHEEAHLIKVKYGLGVSKKQKQIFEAAGPVLESLMKEIRRMIRYHGEHSITKGQISQVVTLGGGANMPGIAEYMTDKLRLPVRPCHPWDFLDFGGLKPPSETDRSMFLTVAGLALIEPKEIFA